MLNPAQIAKSGTEQAEQTALFAWAALPEIRKVHPELEWMFAIPNGGTRDKIEAGRLKAAGVRAGVWDIFLPAARRSFHGAFIEMKVGKNSTSDKQDDFRRYFQWAGYFGIVCYSWEDAAREISLYLSS